MPYKDDEHSLRDILRRETRSAHDRVDTLFGSCDLATRAGYVRFLRAQAAAWRTLKPVLDAPSQDRLQAVSTDLAQLGAAMPAALDGAALLDRGAIGMRYVLEGSRLGSTVLLRELAERAPELIQQAGAYFRCSTDIAPWKTLSTMLQSYPRNDASDAAIIADAKATFDIFERAFHATAGD